MGSMSSGCAITNANVHHSSRTFNGLCKYSGARKGMHALRWKHIWNIVQRGGKLEKARTNSTSLARCERPA